MPLAGGTRFTGKGRFGGNWGKGIGRGRSGDPFNAGRGSEYVCSKCSNIIQNPSGDMCKHRLCPKCGAVMNRK